MTIGARLDRLERRLHTCDGRPVHVLQDDHGHMIDPSTGGVATLEEIEARYPGRTLTARRIGGLSFADDI